MEVLFRKLDGYIEVRELTRDNKLNKRVFFKTYKQFLDYTPSADCNVYIGMFSRKNKWSGTKDDCKTTPVIWLDFDDMSWDSVKKSLEKEGLPYPTAIVNSGNGFHVYWGLTERIGHIAGVINNHIAKKVGADTGATDVARVMRLPGTNNVKDEQAKPCFVIEQRGVLYDVKDFERFMFGEKRCLQRIYQGVTKGSRNFGLGKLLFWLKENGVPKAECFDIIQEWNVRNSPPKPQRELVSEFSFYWDKPYKYLGCKFSSPRLNELNQKFCDKDNCNYFSDVKINVLNGESCVKIDNRLLNNPDTTGMEIAIYSMLYREKELTRPELAELMNRNPKSASFVNAIRSLSEQGFVKQVGAIPPKGIPQKIAFINRTTSEYGYTELHNLVTDLFRSKHINDNEYKMLAILKSYAYSENTVYPTIETLSNKLKITKRSTSRILESLEREKLIERVYKPTVNNNVKLFCVLKY